MSVQRGFTLLEMLVVMVLLGLVTSMALPAMQRWHDAIQHKAQAAAIVDALRAAGFNAGANRRDIVVDRTSFQQGAAPTSTDTGARTGRPGDGPAAPPAGTTDAANVRQQVASAAGQPLRLALELPGGWQAERVDDIRFLANGLCRPGTMVLRTDRGDAVRVEVRGPLCGVELAADQGRSP